MRYSKAITFPIVVLLLAILNPIFAASSQTTTTVFMTPSTSSPRLGETFHMNVSLSNVQNLYGLEVILKWNPTVLRALGADIRLGVETFPDGILHESSSTPAVFIAENNLTQTEGEYRLVATSVSSVSSFSGSGNIVKLTFEATVVGISALDLESQLLDYPPSDRDPRISLPIAHSSQDSSITVKTPTPGEPPHTDSTPPKIKVVSPVDQTYSEFDVSLVFNVDESFNWAGYSLDGKENVTVMGNVTLGDLSNGLHTATVYANDTSGNMGVSEARSFVVAVPETEPFPVVPVAAASIVVAFTTCALLLFYFKKRNRKPD